MNKKLSKIIHKIDLADIFIKVWYGFNPAPKTVGPEVILKKVLLV